MIPCLDHCSAVEFEATDQALAVPVEEQDQMHQLKYGLTSMATEGQDKVDLAGQALVVQLAPAVVVRQDAHLADSLVTG